MSPLRELSKCQLLFSRVVPMLHETCTSGVLVQNSWVQVTRQVCNVRPLSTSRLKPVRRSGLRRLLD